MGMSSLTPLSEFDMVCGYRVIVISIGGWLSAAAVLSRYTIASSPATCAAGLRFASAALHPAHPCRCGRLLSGALMCGLCCPNHGLAAKSVCAQLLRGACALICINNAGNQQVERWHA